MEARQRQPCRWCSTTRSRRPAQDSFGAMWISRDGCLPRPDAHRAGELLAAEYVAGGGFGDQAVGIAAQQEPLGDGLFGRGLDCVHITLVVRIALFERRTRIAGREALGLGSGEW